MKKAPPPKECLDLDVAINEVIVLARTVTLRDGVSVKTRLAEGLLQVLEDHVQLQQVLLKIWFQMRLKQWVRWRRGQESY